MMTYRGWSPIGRTRKWSVCACAPVFRWDVVGAYAWRTPHSYADNYATMFWHSATTHLARTLSGSMNLSRLLCSRLRNDRCLSEINARGLWHAIHFNLRSVSFMTRDNDDVLVPLVYLLLLVAAGVRSVLRTLYILHRCWSTEIYVHSSRCAHVIPL